MCFDINWLANPEVFKVNRMDAHSYHSYYRNVEEVKKSDSTFLYSLDGPWKFHYSKNYDDSIKDFYDLNVDCKRWKDITVPGHLETQGYDLPQYVGVMYPWDGHEEVNPGQVPVDFNPVGSYVKYFNLPKNMEEGPVYVSFQGVESGFSVWMNGHFVGYSEDSFTPADFDISPYIRKGENKLSVQVYKWTSGSWLEDQDFYRFSGIFREVYIYTVPKVHISDLSVKSIINDDFTSAKMNIEVKSSNKGIVRGKLFEIVKETSVVGEGILTSYVEVQQFDFEIKELRREDGNIVITEVVTKVITINNPKLWSAEKPNLYLLELTVMNSEGEIQEIVRERVGFRKFELKDGLMLINGQRIVFKGANRHEFSCIDGRALRKEDMVKDVIIMKQNNINAVRTSHYPNHPYFYELCDEYGLYVIDEANLETHGTWSYGVSDKTLPYDHPEWLDIVLDRVNTMVQRDKNHPSIIIWSCGNESHGGKNIYEMSLLFKKLDNTRLVHYEGICHDRRYNDTSDMESQMYAKVYNIKKFLENNKEKPFICCEYTHSMGNSNGAMHKYTDLAYEEHRYQGGFIWDFIDQTILAKDRYGKEYYAYGGDIGDKPCDYNFCTNGIVYSDRTISSKMQEVKYNYQNIRIECKETTALIKNLNLFTNVNEYQGLVTVLKDGHILKRKSFIADIAPLEEQVIQLSIEKEVDLGEYVVRVSFHTKYSNMWSSAGHEVAFGEFVYQVEEGILEDTILEENMIKKTELLDTILEENMLGIDELVSNNDFTIIQGSSNIGIRGEHFHVIFDKGSKGLVMYKYCGRDMFTEPPAPNFWRAPIDNDNGNRMTLRYSQWKLASLYPSIDTANWREENDHFVIEYNYKMPTIPESTCKLTYTVYGSGRIKLALDYEKVDGLSELPEFGVIMKMAADYDTLTWYGYGPEENYIDRNKGTKLGIYEKKVLDNLSGYVNPQECGNKTGVRYAIVTNRNHQGIKFMCNEGGEITKPSEELQTAGRKLPMEFSALPYTPHELENAMHRYELPEVHHTVIKASLMQMGVGGDDSWGATTHDEYRIPNESMHFELSFIGVVAR